MSGVPCPYCKSVNTERFHGRWMCRTCRTPFDAGIVETRRQVDEEPNASLRARTPQVEGGIVWEEKAERIRIDRTDEVVTMPVLESFWADLQGRVFGGKSFVVQLDGFKSERDAKLFAEACLKLRFEQLNHEGEAKPLDEVLGEQQEGLLDGLRGG